MPLLSWLLLTPDAHAGGSWTWFHMIPGVDDGSLFPFLTAPGQKASWMVITSWFIVAVVALVALMANRSLKAVQAQSGPEALLPSDKLDARGLMELFTAGLTNLATGVFGGRKNAILYLPLIGTLFIYILFSNLIGAIPGFLPPTGDISNVAAMSILVFLIFNIQGIRVNGMGYFKHMAGPIPALAWFIFSLETIGLVIRPVSLSLRIFGNLNGDHLVLGAFSSIVPLVVPVIFLALGIFVAFIQAFVFTLLTVVYVALAIAPMDEHH